ncbi:hypothetical protein [Trichormus variabilis]|uniref:Uncharacterized protein n=1 Tax=Trichormus variabilis SAG 1403-4b TaxID=447716 RepID=A0A433UEP7_ANAVA|nr:hypothetical protein [Trichormus variabilis]RUS92290.1 hypothetical protein DSM107003_51520 [Trichormus variabilis SAG 1403-4b]
MIGQLFTTGIGIYQQYPCDDNKWIAEVFFEDESHAQLRGVQGTLATKYGDDLFECVRTVKQDAENLGIRMLSLPNTKFKLYVKRLFVDNAEVWKQIEGVAKELDLEVVSCLPK